MSITGKCPHMPGTHMGTLVMGLLQEGHFAPKEKKKDHLAPTANERDKYCCDLLQIPLCSELL